MYSGSDRATTSASLFIHSVFTVSSFDLPSDIDPTRVNPNITSSESEVYRILTSLDSSKASGSDGIGPEILLWPSINRCVTCL